MHWINGACRTQYTLRGPTFYWNRKISYPRFTVYLAVLIQSVMKRTHVFLRNLKKHGQPSAENDGAWTHWVTMEHELNWDRGLSKSCWKYYKFQRIQLNHILPK